MAEDRKEMLHNIFAMGDTQVREVMSPRTDVTAVDIDAPIADIISVFRKTNYSRIPVYRESFDNVVGILYVKDIVQHLQRPGEINLQVALRPVHFVPDTARLDPVLRQMQSMHLHMGIVVDEFGGVEGNITHEDLLEEIVGEIRDEHEIAPLQFEEMPSGEMMMPGGVAISDVNERLGLGLPEGEYSTLAGFVLSALGRIPLVGEDVVLRAGVFRVVRMDGRRIARISFRPAALPNDY
jgi:putative hemolysin